MKPLATALVGGLLLLALGAPASAQPVAPIPPFLGPPVHAGAWKTQRAWSDPFEGDRAKGSYAYAYRTWARERADRHVAEGTRLDCADLSIALVCEYAALHALPLRWRVYNAPERKFVAVGNEDPQFGSPAQFGAWSQYYLGAMNLADNTHAITYDEWAGGDMVLMDWNQSPESPNFEGRTVWHTFLIGVPGESIYYGNIDAGVALPVTRTEAEYRLDMVKSHPDRHGESPRRFSFFAGAVWGPEQEVAEVVRASRLNLRAGPGTGHAVLEQGARGEVLEVLGRSGSWVRVRLADGREAWAHAMFLELSRRPLAPAAPAEPAAGLAGALAGSM